MIIMNSHKTKFIINKTDANNQGIVGKIMDVLESFSKNIPISQSDADSIWDVFLLIDNDPICDLIAGSQDHVFESKRLVGKITYDDEIMQVSLNLLLYDKSNSISKKLVLFDDNLIIRII